MQLVSNYMRDDALRHALNDLTRKHSALILKAG